MRHTSVPFHCPFRRQPELNADCYYRQHYAIMWEQYVAELVPDIRPTDVKFYFSYQEPATFV